ncbi:MAG: hypothetical protein KAS32_00465 [Candidatus Peribacteraceae bacterium]|jgi:hypothetical protein|nr:hypothetical protein [Candidatus Peribacteraceae bacterium]
MFGTIIKTDSSGELKLDRKFINLCPELFSVYKDKNLGSKMLRYIVNVYDNNSIYRHLPLDVRKEDVSLSIWDKKEHPRAKHPKVKAAIELYQYVQYDPLKDQYDAMINKNKEKIRVYNKMDITNNNFGDIIDFETKMQKSTEGLEKLRERIQAQEEERQIMGNTSGDLSFIEEMILKRDREL